MNLYMKELSCRAISNIYSHFKGKFIEEIGVEHPAQNLGLTARQLFWISWARLFCIKYDDLYLKHTALRMNQSIGRFRIIGTVQNREEFARDFGCKAGSEMNPTDKCSLWH